MIDKKLLWEELQKIPDPELGISIVDLGLIYELKINKKDEVRVVMTLTTMGCPLFDLIAGPIQESLGEVRGVKDVVVELTFEPPWDPSKMSEEARVKLGFF